MAIPQAIVDHGVVPSTAFTISSETDLLIEQVVYTATRREQRFTTAGHITGLRYDQPEMTVGFSGKMTGSGSSADSAVLAEHGSAVTTDFANFDAAMGPIHGHLASDGVVVYMNPVRTVTEDEATISFDLMHFPGM